jgi:hypothetical protein
MKTALLQKYHIGTKNEVNQRLNFIIYLTVTIRSLLINIAQNLNEP